jgi:hypothetical protein
VRVREPGNQIERDGVREDGEAEQILGFVEPGSVGAVGIGRGTAATTWLGEERAGSPVRVC